MNVQTETQEITDSIRTTLTLRHEAENRYGRDTIFVTRLPGGDVRACKGIDEATALVTELEQDPTTKAIWTNLQKFKPNSEGRKKANCIAYRNIVLDIDRRIKTDKDGNKVNATEEERAVLLAKVEEINAYMKTTAMGSCHILADSGNGYHMNWRVANLAGMVTPEECKKDYTALLAELCRKFESPDVNMEIDQSLADETQVVTVWGTWNRKYPNTPARPQRQSKIIYHSATLIYPADLMMTLDTLKKDAKESGFVGEAVPASEASEGDYPICTEDWLENHGAEDLIEWGSPFIELIGTESKDDGEYYFYAPCLGHSNDEDGYEHDQSDAAKHSAIIEKADGGLAHSCWSQDLTIGGVIHKLEKLKGEKYPHQIFEREPFDPSLIEGFAEQADDDLAEGNRAGTVAFATLDEAKAAGQEFNNKGRLCRVCGEGIVVSAMDTECPECQTPDLFQPEEGKFEMVRRAENGVIRQIVGIDASTVKPKSLEWLWHHKIPANAITWYYGAQGSAKSASTVELAATVSTGRDYPDGAKNELGPRRVLMYNAEDDIERTVIPRLMAAGADLKMITLFDEKSFRSFENGEVVKRSIDLTKDIPIIASMLTKYSDVALIICDPITGIWGGKDINRDREVVGILEKLKALCEKKKVTFIGVSHTNKRSDVSALEKVLGSSSITGKCRSAWMFSQDPDSDNPHDHVMVWAKGNLSGERKGMKFSTVGVEMEFEGKKELYPKIVWHETTDTTADDVMIKKREKREGKGDKREKAKEWLRIVLSEGPVRSPKVYKFVEEKGISSDTIKRAISEMIDDSEMCKPRQKNDGWWMALSKHKLELWGEPEMHQRQPVMEDVEVL